MKNKKEDFEIAKEHISLAEDIILEESKFADEKRKKILENAEFSLEKAEADIDEYIEKD